METQSRFVSGRAMLLGALGAIIFAGLLNAAPAAAQVVCGNGTLEAGEDCDDGNTVGGDCCSAVCLFETNAIVCRAAAGPCDAAERCTGTSATCPVDGFLPATVACRPDTDVCDAPEYCSGSSICLLYTSDAADEL